MEPVLFGQILRQARTNAGLTQRELSQDAQVSERTVSDLERGVTPTARLTTARQLADALGLTGIARSQFLEAATGQRGSRSSTLPPAVAAALRTLPRDVPRFTGRERELGELAAAMEQVADSSGAAKICVIHGMPGAGKSAIAVHFAHQVAGRFPDGQLFVRLHGHTPGQQPAQTADTLSALLLAAGIPPQLIPEDLEARANLWRDRMADRCALVLLDDATGSEQVQPLLPGSAATLVLITSRRRLTALPEATDILVDIMDPEEAAELFMRLASQSGRHLDRQDVADVAALCGYLPLAISLMAGHLKQRLAWTAADLASALTRGDSKIGQMVAEQVSVADAFTMSYQNLAAGLQRLFRHLGLHPGADIDAYAAAAVNASDPVSAQRMLDDLFGHHLIDEPVLGRYRFHDLIREHARLLAAAEPAAERAAAEERLLDYYLHMARAADQHLARHTAAARPDAGGAPPAHAPELPTWRKAVDWMDADYLNLHVAAEYAAIHGRPRYAIAMASSMDAYLVRRGHWKEALHLHRLAQKSAASIGDYASTARALSDMGNLEYMTGDLPAATASLTKALSLFRDLKNPPGAAYAHRRLAAIRYVTGKYQTAMDACRTALALSRDAGDRWGTADAISLLGVMQYDTGDYQAALTGQSEALEISTELDDFIGQANALCFLGDLQSAAGRHAEAVAGITRAREIYRDIGDSWSEAGALYYLGTAQRAAGMLDVAEANLNQALYWYTRAGDKYDEAGVLNQLGILQTVTSRYADAHASLTRAQELYRDFNSRNGEAEVLNSMGELKLACAVPDEAAAYHRTALAISSEIGILREEARALEGVGRSLLYSDGRSMAVDSLRKAHEIYERIGSSRSEHIQALLDWSCQHPGAGGGVGW